MRNEQKIRAEILVLETRMIKRYNRLKTLSEALCLSAAQMAPDIRPERAETMRDEFETHKYVQEIEANQLATLRWVVGDMEEIDPSKIKLV